MSYGFIRRTVNACGNFGRVINNFRPQIELLSGDIVLKVLDLFSGIGGFSLGLERAGMETVAFCELDKDAHRVLRKHWPSVPIHTDIKTLDGRMYRDIVQVVCGGFPCTDISRAGKMKGLSGERSGLWFEMKRIIKESTTNYVIIENVTQLRSNGLSTVLEDLFSLGFDAEWHCIPGHAVGSPQVRDRIYIVAYSRSLGHRRPGWVGRWISSTEEARRLGWRANAKENVQLWVEPSMDRVANGVPSEVFGCRKLGNAVIPQIPEIIGRAIMSREGLRV